MEKETEFKSNCTYRIKVEKIDGIKYYIPQKATHPHLMETRTTPKYITDHNNRIVPAIDYDSIGEYHDMPIISTDAMDKDIVKEIIANDLFRQKRESGLFIEEYIEV